MRIATWNVERLERKRNLADILTWIEKIKADILVLTETDIQIQLDYKNCFSTPILKDVTYPVKYRDTENRVSIFTNMEDITRLSGTGKSICVAGDYNCSFCDNYYYTKDGKKSILKCFEKNQISLLTADRAECIDHIAISKSFLKNATMQIGEWNYEKTISDHKGIVVEI